MERLTANELHALLRYAVNNYIPLEDYLSGGENADRILEIATALKAVVSK